MISFFLSVELHILVMKQSFHLLSSIKHQSSFLAEILLREKKVKIFK